MGQVRISERRSGHDRRMAVRSAYTGPERRINTFRRKVDLVVCIYCKRACGSHGKWDQDRSTMKDIDECQAGICPDCSSRRFPKFYTDN